MSKNEDDHTTFIKDPSSRLCSSTKHIYEVFVEYVNTSKDKQTEPKILQTFPKGYEWDEDTKKNFPKFCFPCKPLTLEKQQYFTFTLTDIDGNYRFGFCYFPKENGCTKCFCFFSYLPWFEFFYWALDRINDFKKDLSEVHKVEPFLLALHEHSVPEVGTMDQPAPVISILPRDSLSQAYKFPLPHPHKTPSLPTDHNLHLMFTNLSHQVIIAIFASAIFERRIIMHSKSLSLLSACIHATDLLLYPLHWQHIFCPIMSPSLMEYCCAPMPFLMGIHDSIMQDVYKMPIDDVVIVDLDDNQLESPYLSMDLEGFPPSLLHGLEKVLKKPTSTQGENVAKAFMDLFVAIIGGYQSALKLRPGDKEITFDRDLFIKSRTTNMALLLENLLQFQHFQQFINGRIQRKKGAYGLNRDRFDDAVSSWEDNPHKSNEPADAIKDGIISAVKFTKKGLSSLAFQRRIQRDLRGDGEKQRRSRPGSDIGTKQILIDQNIKRPVERSITQLPRLQNDPSYRDPETVRRLVQLKQAHMNKTPPPKPKSYHAHKLERNSLVETEIEKSTEIPQSSSNHSLPNICVSATVPADPPVVGDLVSFSPPPTPPPRRRNKRVPPQVISSGTTLDVPDEVAVLHNSSSDDVDTSSTSSSSSSSSSGYPISGMIAPPVPPRDELSDYVTLLQSENVDLSLIHQVPPSLPPRDEVMDSPVFMPHANYVPSLPAGNAPALPPRDHPRLPPKDKSATPPVPPRDRKRLSPRVSRNIVYTPPLEHKNFSLGPRSNSADVLHNLTAPDITLMDMEEDQGPDDEGMEFGEIVARELLAQDSRSSFTEEIARKLQCYSFMRPSKAVMYTLSSDDPFSSSLPPPLIPSTSSPQVERKPDHPSATSSSNPLDSLLNKNDLTRWVTSSASQQESHATANGNVLT